MNGNSDDALILLHVNIRSLQKNFDLLCELITLLNFTPQIICITETRIKDQPLINVAIPNYSFVHANSTSTAGGVAVYLHCSLKYILYHQQFCLSNSECKWIKVCSPFSKFILEVVYRHPCGVSVDKFIDDFDKFLDVFTTEGKLYYILGDFNINTALNQTSAVSKKFLSTLINNGAIPLITKATRVSDHSSTIIDHIITNDIKNNNQPGVIESCYLSDHYPIFCKIGKPTPAPSSKKCKHPANYFRDKSKFNPEVYNLDLNLALSNLFEKTPEINSQTFDTVFNKFVKTIKDIIDTHASLKSYSRRQKRLKRKPWITKDILVYIRKKNSMFKPYFINGNAAQKHLFKTYTNKLTKTKALSKSLFYKNELGKKQK